jgi:hypothetical protein
LNGRQVKEAVSLDQIVSQFEPDDPKGMGGSVIIIEISIRIDKSCLQFQDDPLNFLNQFSGPSFKNGHSTLS